MRFSSPLAAGCAAILSLSLSACGGGGDGGAPALAVASPDALKITDTTPGTGATASAGTRVQVNYTGWLYSAAAADSKGAKFDATETGKPFTFVVGAVGTNESAIAGFSQGVQGMKVDGKRTLLIPSALAYGTQGVPGRIPANAGVVFDVELVKVCGAAAC
ncbi:FKBP-type peptidyl-prolyl cis-trans isomerase [Massilia sp. 9096]|uniref:FKBP-type peptidyl-prolyl cis-trans isomerase n=1 Tax=Massilia sp. 9096 TaxID=1500894 RepID=UPI00056B2C95|nr:FKBP-type peptidyl-prolyl cis-trans isomerase [Massilia sp. 9096]